MADLFNDKPRCCLVDRRQANGRSQVALRGEHRSGLAFGLPAHLRRRAMTRRTARREEESSQTGRMIMRTVRWWGESSFCSMGAGGRRGCGSTAALSAICTTSAHGPCWGQLVPCANTDPLHQAARPHSKRRHEARRSLAPDNLAKPEKPEKIIKNCSLEALSHCFDGVES